NARLCCFFQAEDGIRGFHVTGVQTCALPILILTLAKQLMRSIQVSTRCMIRISSDTAIPPWSPRNLLLIITWRPRRKHYSNSSKCWVATTSIIMLPSVYLLLLRMAPKYLSLWYTKKELPKMVLLHCTYMLTVRMVPRWTPHLVRRGFRY